MRKKTKKEKYRKAKLSRFSAGPRALLSWFQSGRKGLGSCNHFEELNK